MRDHLPSRGFAKLDSGIVDSTLWMKDHDVLRVWVALLAKCDSYGIVRASVPAMAHLCRVTVERFEQIVRELTAPDPYSRTPDHGGRRLEAVEGGWVLLNYVAYRELGQRKAGSHAERQARYRQRLKERDSRVTGSVTSDTEAEAEAEAESRTSKKNSARKAPRKSIPENFGISERIRAWAAAHGHDRLEERLVHFIGYAKRSGRTYADWDAAFESAVREDWAKLTAANGARRVSAVAIGDQDYSAGFAKAAA